MKKNDVFTFTAPNGVEVTAVVISVVDATLPCKIDKCWTERRMLYTCYGQNRIFTMTAKIEGSRLFWKEVGNPEYGEVLVDYAVLPDYDGILEVYNLKIVEL
jgi:hypothetical protein